MSDITRILARIEDGDPVAAEELLPLVYQELRRLAQLQLASEAPGQTLQGTALVHEAYLRLVDVAEPQLWNGRGHFFAAAAEAMRRILVDRARSRQTAKRGGGARPLTINEEFVAAEGKSEEILAVNEALGELETYDEQAAQLVKLRYFVGMQHQEAAKAMGISRRAADRVWLIARAWLFKRLKSELGG